MSITDENTCRLCFKVADIESEVIDDFIKRMLDVLILRTNWNLTKDPMVCQDCVKRIKSSLHFKLACMSTDLYIISFAVEKVTAEIEMKDIPGGNQSFESIVQKEFGVCRFCMKRLERNKCVPVEHLIGQSPVMEMFPVFMPELDISVVKNPLTCVPCGEELESYFKFVLNCLDVEEKINKHRDKEAFCLSKINVDSLRKCTQLCQTNQEPNEFGMEGNVYIDKQEQVKAEETVNKDEAVGEIYKCSVCPYEARRKVNLKKHEFIHKDISEVQVYKCTVCLFATVYKSALKRHLIIHKNTSERDVYNCTMCAYGTIHKAVLKKHILIHKDPSEVETYKCTVCTYETRHKYNLKKHELIHKDVSDEKTHKCAICNYRTRHKCHLTEHMLIHKDTSDLETFKCVFCNYETRHKSNHKRHMATHKNISQMEVYKCTMCTYKTVHKYALKRHSKIHKVASEREIYKCTICALETRHKYSLRKHMSIHEVCSERRVYKCTLCTFKSIYMDDVKQHMLLQHKYVLDVEKYKCTMCTYKARRQGTLKNHMLKHKGTAEVQMYKMERKFKTSYATT